MSNDETITKTSLDSQTPDVGFDPFDKSHLPEKLQKQIDRGFRGSKRIRRAGIQIEYTPEQQAEFVRCAMDPLYFIENYIRIKNVDAEQLILFKTRSYQQEMVAKIIGGRETIIKLPRQCGKTSCVSALLVWHLIFNPNYAILCAAHKGDKARDVLSNMREMYESLPYWLQHGVDEWSKGFIKLENGSRAKSSATTASSARGDVYNCVTGDTEVTVRETSTGRVETISIEELHERLKKANSSRYIAGNVSGKQVHSNLPISLRPGEESWNIRRTDREASRDAKVSRRLEHERQSSSIDSSRTYLRASTLGQDDRGEGKEQYALGSSLYAQLSAFQDSYRENISERENQNSLGSERAFQGTQSVSRDEGQNEPSTQGSSKERVSCWGHLCSIDEQDEDGRTRRQDQSQSREDTEDGREASGNEALNGVSTAYERSSQGSNSLERREEDERRISPEDARREGSTPTYEILSEDDEFLPFDGIKMTCGQHIITLFLDNGKTLKVTPNHEILTEDGWVEAYQTHGMKVLTKNGYSHVLDVLDTGETADVYDPINVNVKHSFQANEIIIKNCIYLDEFAFVEDHLAEEFVRSVMPTISSGKTTKTIITSTPQGMNMFFTLWDKAVKKKTTYQYVEIKWNDVPGRDDAFRDKIVAEFGQAYFDQEYGAEFIGSGLTLIAGHVLNRMSNDLLEPINDTRDSKIRVYAAPVKGRHYALCADISEGLGQDASAFLVLDITETPYTIAMAYQNNEVDEVTYAGIVHDAAHAYNEAMLLIEANYGAVVGRILWEDLEYPNLIRTVVKKELQNPGPGGQRSRTGVRMDVKTKRIGCSTLKLLAEQDQLKVCDDKTLNELYHFVVDGKSYAADRGHDDLAMCLVMFAWMVDNDYVKAVTDVDARARIAKKNAEAIEQQMLSAGFSIQTAEDIQVIEEQIDWDNPDLRRTAMDHMDTFPWPQPEKPDPVIDKDREHLFDDEAEWNWSKGWSRPR
jgi:hypothetical protein